MKIKAVMQMIYSLYLINIFGLRLKMTKNPVEKKRLRVAYSKKQLGALNITVRVENPDKIPANAQYLLISNHRSVFDPPIIELALESTTIFGLWVSKKELYNSIYFGLFVRNGGSVLLDREKSQMSGFFKDVREGVSRGSSIFIFPEGTRNKGAESLMEFKEGSRIIALKNRLPILPVYIKTDSSKALKDAIKDDTVKREIVVVFGDTLEYRSRENLEEQYREMFDIS